MAKACYLLPYYRIRCQPRYGLADSGRHHSFMEIGDAHAPCMKHKSHYDPLVAERITSRSFLMPPFHRLVCVLGESSMPESRWNRALANMSSFICFPFRHPARSSWLTGTAMAIVVVDSVAARTTKCFWLFTLNGWKWVSLLDFGPGFTKVQADACFVGPDRPGMIRSSRSLEARSLVYRLRMHLSLISSNVSYLLAETSCSPLWRQFSTEQCMRVSVMYPHMTRAMSTTSYRRVGRIQRSPADV